MEWMKSAPWVDDRAKANAEKVLSSFACRSNEEKSEGDGWRVNIRWTAVASQVRKQLQFLSNFRILPEGSQIGRGCYLSTFSFAAELKLTLAEPLSLQDDKQRHGLWLGVGQDRLVNRPGPANITANGCFQHYPVRPTPPPSSSSSSSSCSLSLSFTCSSYSCSAASLFWQMICSLFFSNRRVQIDSFIEFSAPARRMLNLSN